MQRVTLAGSDRSVQLIAIEAVALHRTPTAIKKLLASKLNVLSSQASAAGVALSVTVADDVPAVVHVDSDKLAWAVTTLVGNALRYMQTGSRHLAGGLIAVRAGFDPARAELTIEVQDDGPGIPADTIARLFKRDSLNVRGSGLALLLMSDVCRAHGGTIEVRSSTAVSGHGTTVRMTLPTKT
jgi:signal transduction histidine kinase